MIWALILGALYGIGFIFNTKPCHSFPAQAGGFGIWFRGLPA